MIYRLLIVAAVDTRRLNTKNIAGQVLLVGLVFMYNNNIPSKKVQKLYL